MRKGTLVPSTYNVNSTTTAIMSQDLKSTVAAFLRHSVGSQVQADTAIKNLKDKAIHMNKHKDDYLKSASNKNESLRSS